MKNMSGIESIIFRPNGPTSRNWPNGPKSLSPGHRPGYMPPIDWRPEGPRSVLAWFRAQPYRAPLARGIPTDVNPGRCPSNPGRCPGLRNHAPLARQSFLMRPNGPTSLSPGQRPGTAAQMIGRPDGPRYGAAWFRVPPYRAPLARRIPSDIYPGRCPGLRNDAPLARKRSTMRKYKMNFEYEIAKGRKEREGVLK
jgi:hypothetical protein